MASAGRQESQGSGNEGAFALIALRLLGQDFALRVEGKFEGLPVVCTISKLHPETEEQFAKLCEKSSVAKKAKKLL